MAVVLRQSPIHRALHRPTLIMGCEREPFLFTAILAAGLIFVMMTWLTTVIGLLVWLGFTAGLRKAAKSDTKMIGVFIRHVRFQSYYPPRGTPFSASIYYKNQRWE